MSVSMQYIVLIEFKDVNFTHSQALFLICLTECGVTRLVYVCIYTSDNNNRNKPSVVL